MFSSITNMFGSQLSKMITNIINLNKKKEKEDVYVIGNGWAGYYFVKYLDKTQFNPIIIAPNSKVLNTQKLVNRIINPNEDVEFTNPHAQKIIDIVVDIDMGKKTLLTSSGKIIPYSKVIFAIGSEPNDFGIEGVEANTYKLKTISDANLLEKKIKSLYTDSRIYIIGCGVTGIELATNITKLEGFNGFRGVNIRLMDGLDMILPGYNLETKKTIKKEIETNYKNIEVLLNHKVNSIYKQCRYSNELQLKYYNINNSKSESFWLCLNPKYISDIIIWTGGVRFNGYRKTKLFESLNKISPIKPRGLDVEKDFSFGCNNKDNSIYCLGDMVANMGPPTAQNAKNQAIWLAKYFNSNFNSEYLELNPYQVKSKGKLVHLNEKVYLESEYYSGWIPKFVAKLIEYVGLDLI